MTYRWAVYEHFSLRTITCGVSQMSPLASTVLMRRLTAVFLLPCFVFFVYAKAVASFVHYLGKEPKVADLTAKWKLLLRENNFCLLTRSFLCGYQILVTTGHHSLVQATSQRNRSAQDWGLLMYGLASGHRGQRYGRAFWVMSAVGSENPWRSHYFIRQSSDLTWYEAWTAISEETDTYLEQFQGLGTQMAVV